MGAKVTISGGRAHVGVDLLSAGLTVLVKEKIGVATVNDLVFFIIREVLIRYGSILLFRIQKTLKIINTVTMPLTLSPLSRSMFLLTASLTLVTFRWVLSVSLLRSPTLVQMLCSAEICLTLVTTLSSRPPV